MRSSSFLRLIPIAALIALLSLLLLYPIWLTVRGGFEGAGGSFTLYHVAQVATDQALALAGKLLQQKLQPADHARLIEESLAKFPKTPANLN